MKEYLKITRTVLCTLLAILLLSTTLFVPVASADYSTGVGLAAHALNAYYNNWSYVYGGSTPGAVDCSGLIYTYNGVGGVRSSMLSSSSESGYINNGIPNIHGLGLHQPGHVGVYLGGGMAVDARSEYYGICYQSVYTKNWTSWFKVAGVNYPNTGWVKFQGDSYYYQDGEYVTSTAIDYNGVTYYFDAYGKSSYAPDDSAYLATDYSSTNVSDNYYSDYSDSQSSSSSNESNDDYYTPAVTPEKSKYTTLYNGYVGDDVKKLQTRLQALGYFNTDVTDFYGSVTESAVCKFQEAASLDITGIADEETQEAVYADDAPILETKDLSIGDYSDETMMVQEKLKELGYFYDEPTGYFGEVTAIAVSQFQSVNGLYSTGVVDSLTNDFIFYEGALRNPNEGSVSYGMKGDSVKAIQQRLIDLRYIIGTPSEEFDDETLDAIHLYQKTAGIPENDSLTKDDITNLYSSAAPKSPDFNLLQTGYIGDDVKDLQIKLMSLDLYDGLLSGHFDEATHLAVIAAQDLFGFEKTGIADADLIAKLTEEQSKSTMYNDNDNSNVELGENIAANVFGQADSLHGEPIVLKDRQTKNTVKLIIIAVILLMAITIVIMSNVLKKGYKKNHAYAYVDQKRNTKREKVLRK